MDAPALGNAARQELVQWRSGGDRQTPAPIRDYRMKGEHPVRRDKALSEVIWRDEHDRCQARPNRIAVMGFECPYPATRQFEDGICLADTIGSMRSENHRCARLGQPRKLVVQPFSGHLVQTAERLIE
jgi:hypothetical protein